MEKLIGSQLSFMNQFYEVTAVSSDETYLKNVADNLGVKYYNVEMTRAITPFQDLKSIYHMVLFFRREKPDIIHSHTPKAGLISMIAGLITGVPTRLHTVAGLPLLEAEGFKRIILNKVEWLTYKCATKVYPNSTKLQNIIIQQKFCSPDKVRVIGNGSSNGVDLDKFNRKNIAESDQGALKKKLGISPQDFVFIFVGRMVKDKGINELVSAFKMILEQPAFDIKTQSDNSAEEDVDGVSKKISLKTLRSLRTSLILSEEFFSDQPSITGLKLRNRLGKVLYKNTTEKSLLRAKNPDLLPNLNGYNTTLTHEPKSLYPHVKLLLVGPLEQELNPILGITLLEIENNPQIIRTGFVKDVRPFMALSNCLILPSYREGFPNVVLQAGAMELPCIVTDINGCNEIISEGKNGLIIPAKSEDGLKVAMLRLLNDTAFTRKLKQNSRSIIAENYSHQKIWDELRQEYDRFLGEKVK